MSNIQGKVKVIFPTQTFDSGFQKREFVITTSDDKYPQDIKFEVLKDKCSELDNVREGSDITVHYNIRGNEYNGKYYVSLQAWKWEALAAVHPPVAVADDDSDDIPF